jgi:hypothetical protein
MKAGATGVKTGGGGALIFLVHCMKSPLCLCCVLRVALPPSFEPSLRRRNLSDEVVGPFRTRFERGVVLVSIIQVGPDLEQIINK